MVVVQTADNQNLVQEVQAVRKGVGKATLAVTPLSEQGRTSTTTVALRTYKVVEK